MIDNCFILRDDISWAGIRRLHLISNDGPVNRIQAEEMVAMENGQIEAISEWEDPHLGSFHFYIAWRLKMVTYPVYGWGIEREPDRKIKDRRDPLDLICQAISKAAARYHKRFERWPDSAVVNEAELEKVEMYQGECVPIKIPYVDGVNGGSTVEIVPVETGWTTGTVGVFVKEKNGQGQNT